MSTKYKGDLYDFSNYRNLNTLYATYHTTDINASKIDVEILDRVTTSRSCNNFWVVQNCDTEEIFLATSSQLEDVYYYGD